MPYVQPDPVSRYNLIFLFQKQALFALLYFCYSAATIGSCAFRQIEIELQARGVLAMAEGC